MDANGTYTSNTRNKRKLSTDRRVTKTKTQLRKTLSELMQEKRAKDITVRELTKHAGISRGTFYLHYDDVIELLESVQSEMFAELKKTMDSFSKNDIEGRPLPVFVEMYKFFQENSDLCGLLFTGDHSEAFVIQLEELMMEKCFTNLPDDPTLDEESAINKQYRVNFALAGCIGIFRNWMKNGMRESPLRMALVTEDTVLNGINSKKQ